MVYIHFFHMDDHLQPKKEKKIEHELILTKLNKILLL
jgi:hypothetical protein